MGICMGIFWDYSMDKQKRYFFKKVAEFVFDVFFDAHSGTSKTMADFEKLTTFSYTEHRRFCRKGGYVPHDRLSVRDVPLDGQHEM